MGQSITFRAPFAIAGDLTRNAGNDRVESQALGASPLGAYGIAVKMVNGLIVPLSAAGDQIYGFLVRPFPTTGANASDPLGTGVPALAAQNAQLSILVSGYIGVFVQEGAGSVASNSAVFARYAASGNLVIGGLGGASIASNNVAITSANSYGSGAFFTGNTDANGLAEVRFNI
jgi:hypothetical protein